MTSTAKKSANRRSAVKVSLLTDIADTRFTDEIAGLEDFSRSLVSAAWLSASKHADALPLDVQISLLLTDDREIKELNKEYRGKDKPTNVLSFANVEDFDAAGVDVFIAGDIVVSFDTLKEEAFKGGLSFKDHFAHLLVHGVLHLAGFDHMEDYQAEEMESLEALILSEFNIGDPYE